MTTSEYKKRIWQYEKRREQSYQTSRRLSSKIRQMKSCLAAREAREKKSYSRAETLLEEVNNFFCVDIRSEKKDYHHKLARNVYYKIGLEMQLRESILCHKVNRRPQTASYNREEFTKSFQTNIENKKVFHNFKNYLKYSRL